MDTQTQPETFRTPRQLALIESISHGEVGYMTHLEGFYFHRPLQFQFADEDQAYLRMLFENGVIMHARLSDAEYEVHLRRDEQAHDQAAP
jgi:hypothetical protein